jgi:hypothetical protein
MGTNVRTPVAENGRRYEAVLRLSEALSACRQPEELTRTLFEQLSGFLHFLHFYILVFKENSKEIEWYALGKSVLAFPDVPIEELPAWRVYTRISACLSASDNELETCSVCRILPGLGKLRCHRTACASPICPESQRSKKRTLSDASEPASFKEGI